MFYSTRNCVCPKTNLAGENGKGEKYVDNTGLKQT